MGREVGSRQCRWSQDLLGQSKDPSELHAPGPLCTRYKAVGSKTQLLRAESPQDTEHRGCLCGWRPGRTTQAAIFIFLLP